MAIAFGLLDMVSMFGSITYFGRHYGILKCEQTCRIMGFHF